jgi:hypothetical protein
MRIVLTGLLSTFVLGAAINPGWCPEPADLDMPLSAQTGATSEARNPPPAKPVPWERSPLNPENMTRTQRLQLLSREKAAGRVTNEQEKQNFLATGNPYKSWTAPETKPLVKPASMSDAQWKQILATRPQQQNYVKGDPGLGSNTMEQNAKKQGGTITTMPGSPVISGPPPVKNTTPTPSRPWSPGSAAAASLEERNKLDSQPKRYKPVTTLGVHSTQAQPAPRLSSSAAVERLGSSQGATGGSKTTMRTGVAAVGKALSPAPTMSALDRMSGVTASGAPTGNTGTKSNARLGAGSIKDAGHTNALKMVPRNFITPPAQRSQDTFRQPR